MFEMDMSTLLSIPAIISAVTALFLWFLFFYNRDVAGIIAIACSNGSFFLGFGLIALRAHLNWQFSVIGGNGFICLAYILILVGLAQFFKNKLHSEIYALLFIGYMTAFSYLTCVDNNFSARLSLFLTSYATMMLCALWMTVSEYRKQHMKSYLVASMFMALLAIQFYTCALVSMFSNNGFDILAPTSINLSVILEQIFFIVGWTLSFSLMVSERLYSEKALAVHRYHALVEGAPDAILVYDAELGRLVDANLKAEELFGCSRETLLATGLERFYAPVQPDGRPAAIGFEETCRQVLSGTPVLIERELVDAAERPLFAEARISRLPSARGHLIRCSFLDISERKAAEARLQFLATHDLLTVLPNRLLLMDRLEHAMQAADRSGTRLALLFLDIDSFKSVNDSFGHLVGDCLLQAVAARLSEAVRKNDTVSRQGGDEFLLLLTGLADADSAAVVAGSLLEEMKRPFDLAVGELYTSASIGIALFPDDGRDYVTLRKKADLAMYRSKEDGKNTYHFFDSRIDFDMVEHQRAFTDLQGALIRGEFELHYQPQFNLKSGKLVGAEALLRWRHPVRGLIAPGRFIPLAESSGLIVAIGEWVLREACRQAAQWHRSGLPGLVMAVNLSAVQFKRDNLEQTIIEAIASSGIDPAMLELELTESILIRDTDTVLATVNRLRNLGVKLSIDDFGTGYSSLSYLKRFNVDKVKIDQSFIRDISANPSDATIVKAICMMAHGLNMRTIAEGVEDESHLVPLREYSCDEVQGYLFARPMPPAEFLSAAPSWWPAGI
jgi:diguanylate cyclase (GGDEF)-like protein/PAS domain S-box-containing protein